MAQIIKLKNSSVAAKVPLTTDLVYGEVALNYADGKLYYKKSDGTIQSISGSGGGGGSGGVWTKITTATTATSTKQYLADTTAAAFTVTLPASPVVGDYVYFMDVGTWATNNLTVARNGSTIEGSATDLVFDVSSILVQMIYDGTTWQVASNLGPQGIDGPPGTLTSVIGTAPVVSSVSGSTATVSMAAATTSVDGYLTATDWTTFSNKQPNLGYTPYNATNPSGFTNNAGTITSVTGTAPIISSGGATPAISIPAATASVNGYLTSADWNTFNNKQAAGASAAATTIGTTAPASPVEGQMWYDTTDGTLFIRSGSIWVEAVVTTTGATGASANPLPVGTTAQSPSSPVTGNMRINTDTNYVELYQGSSWFNLTYIGLVTATSTNATITYVGNYAIHTFNTSGTFTPISVPVGGTIDYLIVGGGGGGGSSFGGGGGAGGYLTQAGLAVSAMVYSIIVGAGAPQSAATNSTPGTNGSNSSAFSFTAIGGGAGGSYQTAGGSNTSGGSGGGGGSSEVVTSYPGAAGTAGQGNAGGAGLGVQGYLAGGGGGAGAAGAPAVASTNGGAGGIGLPSSISGTTTYYAGGGGGAAYTYSNGTTAGAGGNGGGGAGTGAQSTRGTAGTTNTGGGGGGGGYGPSSSGGGGAGGSGVVIIRYRYQ